MKKSFGIYSIVWAICLAVFNVITFVTPNEIGGVRKKHVSIINIVQTTAEKQQ